jgi:hypothetical protein
MIFDLQESKKVCFRAPHVHSVNRAMKLVHAWSGVGSNVPFQYHHQLSTGPSQLQVKLAIFLIVAGFFLFSLDSYGGATRQPSVW